MCLAHQVILEVKDDLPMLNVLLPLADVVGSK